MPQSIHILVSGSTREEKVSVLRMVLSAFVFLLGCASALADGHGYGNNKGCCEFKRVTGSFLTRRLVSVLTIDSGSSSNKYFSLEQDHPKSLGITSLWIAAIACLIIASKYFNMIYFNIHILHVSNISIFRTVSFFWVKLRQHVQGRLRLHEGGRR